MMNPYTLEDGAPSGQRSERLLDVRFATLFLFVLMCCLLGGTGSSLSLAMMIVLFFGSLCMAAAIYRKKPEEWQAVPRHAILLVAVIWLFPVLHLIPLPPAIWENLPGRAFAEAVRGAVGQADGWQGMSIGSSDTWVSVFGVTTFAIVFFSSLVMNNRQMRALLWLLCGIAFANILVGAFQVASGGQMFDFYNSGHRANLIGFFPNRNHTALFLSAAMPLFTYLAMTATGKARAYRHYVAGVGVLVLFTGVLGTTSRAGLGMGAVGLFASILMLPIRSRFLQSKKSVAIAGLVTLAAITPILMSERLANVLQRFDTVSSDLRWGIWVQSWEVAKSYLPIGSGFGTYRLAYDPLEPLAMVSPQFVNNAHNDYLELLIEGGIPAVAMLLCVLAAIAVRAVKLAPGIWREGLVSIYTPAILFLIMLIGHSVVDYPIRRPAIGAPLALFLAILWREAPAAIRRRVGATG